MPNLWTIPGAVIYHRTLYEPGALTREDGQAITKEVTWPFDRWKDRCAVETQLQVCTTPKSYFILGNSKEQSRLKKKNLWVFSLIYKAWDFPEGCQLAPSGANPQRKALEQAGAIGGCFLEEVTFLSFMSIKTRNLRRSKKFKMFHDPAAPAAWSLESSFVSIPPKQK